MQRKLLVCLLLTIPGLAFAADPIVGTWKMNVAKSHFNPGPGPKGSTVSYSEEGDWLVARGERTDENGKRAPVSNRFKTDGKEYPYDGPYGKGSTMVTKTDERHMTSTMKVEGGHTVTQKTVISADGKTRTTTSTGTDGKGQSVNNTVVYERQ